MSIQIAEVGYTAEQKKYVFDSFHQHSMQVKGFDGIFEDPIAFSAKKNDKQIGLIVAQYFWGQLHIKYLIIEDEYRGKGIGTELMNKTLAWAKNKGCDFAFVETLNFHAPEFYKKFGFKIDFTRTGFSHDVSFIYLSKKL